MTTTVLQPVVGLPHRSTSWQVMLAFLSDPESSLGAFLLQRNSGIEAGVEISAESILAAIGAKAASRARIHKLADQDEPDSK